MTILYNTNFTHNANAYLTLAVQRAAEVVFGAGNVVLADNRTLAELAASGEHATLICLDGQRLHRPLIERVRPAFQSTVLWLFEDPFMLDYNLAHAGLFDYVFTNDPSCASHYPSGHYLPLAASENLQFRPVREDAACEYDIFFAGTMWPNRVNTLRALLERFETKRFKLVCPTNSYLPPLPRDIAARAVQWPISLPSFVDFANASRVTLTMFRDYASHGSASQATAPGPRLFELAMAGAAQVVELDPALPAGNFRVIEGVACCDSLPALVAEIDTLLQNPALRESRAAAAQRSVRESHCYENRLQQIAAVTQADFTRKAAPKPVAMSARRMRVLMCTHSTMRQPDWGGVEVYQQILVTALAQPVEVLFWLRRGTTCTLEAADGTMLEQFTAPEIGWLDSLTDAAEETAFANALCQYGIDVVHFQHLGHHTASLLAIAKSCGAGTVFSAHDFFLVCSRYNLLNNALQFCDIGERSITACDICLRLAENLPAGAQQTRRSFMAEMLRSVDVLLFGTAYSSQLTRRIYPQLASKRCEVLGIPTPGDARATSPRREPDANLPLKVAVVGNFLRSKGADTILSVIETVDPRRFQFVLFGKAEAQYEEVLIRSAHPHVAYRGRYAVGDLDATDGCDVSLHLSIWPETYCISLSETWQRGIVPIASRIGAFADRIEHGRNGFLVGIGDAAAVVGLLEALRADPGKLAALRANITPDLWTDADSYAAQLLEIYRSVAPRAPMARAALGLDAGQIHLLPHASWRELAPPRHIFDPSRQSDLQLDPPAEITAWIEPHAGRSHIDRVGEYPIDSIVSGSFQPIDRLEVTGWSFVPEMGISGQIYLALVGQDGQSTIFVKANRQLRQDIAAKMDGAPQQAGFLASCELRGKWSDGRYQLATVIVFVDKAAFQLTSVAVELTDGRVTNAMLRPASAFQAERAFRQVAGRREPAAEPALSALPLDGVTISTDQQLRYVFDDIGDRTNIGSTEDVAITPSKQLHLRGWALRTPPTAEAGQCYIGLVGEGGTQSRFWEARRQPRKDVADALPGAPRDVGFVADLSCPAVSDGDWHVALCNIVGGTAVLGITRLCVELRNGRFASVGFSDMAPQARHAFLRRALAPGSQPSPLAASAVRRKQRVK